MCIYIVIRKVVSAFQNRIGSHYPFPPFFFYFLFFYFICDLLLYIIICDLYIWLHIYVYTGIIGYTYTLLGFRCFLMRSGYVSRVTLSTRVMDWESKFLLFPQAYIQ